MAPARSEAVVCQPTEPRTPAASAASQTLELLGNLSFSCLAFPGRQRDGCEEATFLETSRPDVLLHFGADPISTKLIEEAKARDIPVIFWIEDLSCTDRTVLRPADYVVVPSKSARWHYWETLGLACFALLERRRGGGRLPRVLQQHLPAARRALHACSDRLPELLTR